MADPSALAQELEAVVAALGRAQTVHYLHVSSACLFAYDHLVTFPDEVALIWHAPWSIGKILFLVGRYSSWPELFMALFIELSAVPQKVCDNGFIYITWSILVCITVSETILILRTWAIWGGKQVIMFALGGLLLAITAVNAYIVVAYLRKTDLMILPGIPGCLVTSSSRRIATVWITIASFELVILTMTLIKGIEHFRHTSSTLLVSLYRDGAHPRLRLPVLNAPPRARDPVLCLPLRSIPIVCDIFVAISLNIRTAVSLANMTFVLSAPPEYVVLLAQLQRAFHALLSCRIILNLRSARSAPRVASTGTETVSGWFGAKERHISPAIAFMLRR